MDAREFTKRRRSMAAATSPAESDSERLPVSDAREFTRHRRESGARILYTPAEQPTQEELRDRSKENLAYRAKLKAWEGYTQTAALAREMASQVKETRRAGNPKHNDDYVSGVDYPKIRSVEDIESELGTYKKQRATSFEDRFPDAAKIAGQAIGGKDADADWRLQELAQQYADENAAYDAHIAELKKEAKESKNKTVLQRREREAAAVKSDASARYDNATLVDLNGKISATESNTQKRTSEYDAQLEKLRTERDSIAKQRDALYSGAQNHSMDAETEYRFYATNQRGYELHLKVKQLDKQIADTGKKRAAAINAGESEMYSLRGAQTLATLPEASRDAIFQYVACDNTGAIDTRSFSGARIVDLQTGKRKYITKDEFVKIRDAYDAAIAELKAAGASQNDIDRMLTAIRYSVDRVAAAGDSTETAKQSLKYPITMSTASVIANLSSGLFAGVGEAARAVGNIGRADTYKKPMNINGAAYAPTRMTNDIRGTIAERIEEGNGFGGKVGSFAYQTLMSTADSVVSSVLGNVGGAAAIGGSAFASAIVDAKENGVSDEQALMTGICAGIFETLFERISIGNFNKLKEVPPATLRDVAMNVAKSTLVNASEEGFTEIANIAADCIINGDYSGYAEAYNAYINAGKSKDEATRLALLDMAKQIGMAAFGGAVQGGFMGGIGSAWGYFGNRDANRAAGSWLSDGGKVDRDFTAALVRDGMKNGSEETQHYAKTLEGKEADERQAGQLARMIAADGGKFSNVDGEIDRRTSGTETRTADDIRAQLGDAANGDAVADALYQMQEGKFSERDAEVVRSSPEGRALFSEYFDTDITENTSAEEISAAVRDVSGDDYRSISYEAQQLLKSVRASNGYSDGADAAFYRAYFEGYSGKARSDSTILSNAALDAAYQMGAEAKKDIGTFHTVGGAALSKETTAFFSRAAKDLGLSITYGGKGSVKNGGVRRGYANSYRGIHIYEDAKVKEIGGNTLVGGDAAARIILGHELTHILQKQSPTQYKVFETFALQQKSEQGNKIGLDLVSEYMRDHHLDKQSATDEVVADYAMRVLFSDMKTAREVTKHHSKVAEAIRRAFAWIREKLGIQTSEIDRAAAMWNKAYSESRRNADAAVAEAVNRAKGVANSADAGYNGIKNSIAQNNAKLIRYFTGEVRESGDVYLSDRDKAKIVHNVKSGNGWMNESTSSGYVYTDMCFYTFEFNPDRSITVTRELFIEDDADRIKTIRREFSSSGNKATVRRNDSAIEGKELRAGIGTEYSVPGDSGRGIGRVSEVHGQASGGGRLRADNGSGQNHEKPFTVSEKQNKVKADSVESAFSVGEVKDSIAGQNAKTADVGRLADAEQLERAGTDSETVRRETGWYRGYDGKWRFEIDDSKMRFINHREQSRRTWKLDELIRHDALFAAYPELRDYTVLNFGISDDVEAAFYPGLNRITLDPRLSRAEKRTALIHEIQHAIQVIEGFTAGATTDYWQHRLLTDEERRLQMRLRDFDAPDIFFEADMRKLLEGTPTAERDAAQMALEKRYGEASVREYADLYNRLRDMQAERARNAERAYRNTAGEIEAVDVANRIGLSERQRAETRPDIDREEVRFSQSAGWHHAEYDPETAGIKEQLEHSAETLNAMRTVTSVEVPQNFTSKSEAAKWAIETLKRTGYQVDRQGYGVIRFNAKDINRGANYADTSAEKAALAALPAVLKKGIEIGGHANHKAREKQTVTFAAPVELNGIRGNMAVVVNKRGDHYYAHRIVLPDGKAFVFSEKNNATREPSRGVTVSGSLAETTSVASKNSISNSAENVNTLLKNDYDVRDSISSTDAIDINFERRLNAVRGRQTSVSEVLRRNEREARDVKREFLPDMKTVGEVARSFAEIGLSEDATTAGLVKATTDAAVAMRAAYLERRIANEATKDAKSRTAAKKLLEAAEMVKLPDGMSKTQVAAAMADALYQTNTSDRRTVKELVAQYGAIKPGEKPSRTLSVPKRTDEGRNVSEAVRTVLEARVTPDGMVPTIKDAIESGDFSYETITDKASLARAKSKIRRGYQAAYDDFRSAARRGNVSKDQITLGFELYNQAANAGTEEGTRQAMEILADIVSTSRSSAQTLAAMRLLKKMSPDGQLYTVQRTINRINESIGAHKKRQLDRAHATVDDAMWNGRTDAAEEMARSIVQMGQGLSAEEWVDAIGNLVGDGIAARLSPKTKAERLVSQNIRSDILKFAEDYLPRAAGERKSKTAAERLADYFANKDSYERAWERAQKSIREKYADRSDTLAQLDAFLVGTLSNNVADSSVMLSAIAKAAVSEDSSIRQAALRATLGDADGVALDIYNRLNQTVQAEGDDAVVLRDAILRYVRETAAEKATPQVVENEIRRAVREAGTTIGEIIRSDTNERAAVLRRIQNYLIENLGISADAAGEAADIIRQNFTAMTEAKSRAALEAVLKDKPRSVRKTAEERFREYANLGAFEGEYNEAISKKLFGETVRINEKLVQKFRAAETEEQRTKILKDIYRDIGRQIPSTWLEKMTAWRYLSMLFNLTTHIRNVGGNAGFVPVVMAKSKVAWLIESGVGLVNKDFEKTKAFLVGHGDLVKAADADFLKYQEALFDGGKYRDEVNANKYIDEGRHIFRDTLKIGDKGVLNHLYDFNSWALSAEDMVFKRQYYSYALASWCKAHGITAEQIRHGEGLDAARAYAIREAQRNTYNDANAFSDLMTKIGHTGNKYWDTVVSGAQPFLRTPANILARGLEYSPAGLLWTVTRGTYQLRNGEISAAQYIDNLAQGLTGTSILALGAFLAHLGIIGFGGDDDKEKDFEKMYGHQQYSIEIGGKSITLDWLAPESIPFFTGVNFYELMQDGGFSLDDIVSTIELVTDPMLNMSMLQGLNDMIENAKWSNTSALGAVATGALESLISQNFPTLFGKLERIMQPDRMMTYVDKNKWMPAAAQKTLGKLSQKVPGLDYNQIPYIDAWGEKETNTSAAWRAFDQLMNPAYTATVESTPLEQEIIRLHRATNENDMFPTRAQKSFTVKRRKDGNPLTGDEKDDEVEAVDFSLTADQYVKYATYRGKASKRIAEALIKSPYYKQADDKTRREMFAAAYDIADAQAKMLVSDYRPDGWVAKAVTACKETGITEMQYITLHQQNKNIDGKYGGESVDNLAGARKMQMLYKATLSDAQRARLADDFDVGKTVRSWDEAYTEKFLSWYKEG